MHHTNAKAQVIMLWHLSITIFKDDLATQEKLLLKDSERSSNTSRAAFFQIWLKLEHSNELTDLDISEQS